MENNNYPQAYPGGSQYFPPPSAWVDPNSVSDDDNDTPTWVIVGIVIVLVIFLGFLFYFVWRRQKKIRKAEPGTPAPVPPPKKDPPKDAPPKDPPKKDPPPPPPKKDPPKDAPPKDPPKKDPPPPPKPPPMGFPISYPGDCPACGRRGGLYSFSYTCPQCKYKMECNVAYPDKK